jgi:hypothetical protein
MYSWVPWEDLQAQKMELVEAVYLPVALVFDSPVLQYAVFHRLPEEEVFLEGRFWVVHEKDPVYQLAFALNHELAENNPNGERSE